VLQSLHRLKRNIEGTDEARFRPWIFFNYRRMDTAFASDRVYDALKREFGDGAIYRDVYHVRAGADVQQELEKVIQNSRVFLVMIGEHWLAEMRTRQRDHAAGSKRDWVITELEMALGSKTCVVLPLLVSRAEMPSAEELPEPLQALPRLNALRIRREPDFHRDIDKLTIELWDILRMRRATV
jgi:hypothetical protein